VISRYHAQTFLHGGILVAFSLDQVAQHRHQYLHLPAHVHHEDRRETANRRGDVVLDHCAHTVYREDDAISRTRLRVEVHIVSLIHERFVREVASAEGKRQDYMIRHAAGVKEDDAERGEPAPHQRIFQHHSTVVLIAHDPPIVLHLLHALANLLAARAENAVLDRNG